eukprot:UN20788
MNILHSIRLESATIKYLESEMTKILNSKSFEDLCLLGSIYHLLGNYTKAKTTWERALKLKRCCHVLYSLELANREVRSQLERDNYINNSGAYNTKSTVNYKRLSVYRLP